MRICCSVASQRNLTSMLLRLFAERQEFKGCNMDAWNNHCTIAFSQFQQQFVNDCSLKRCMKFHVTAGWTVAMDDCKQTIKSLVTEELTTCNEICTPSPLFSWLSFLVFCDVWLSKCGCTQTGKIESHEGWYASFNLWITLQLCSVRHVIDFEIQSIIAKSGCKVIIAHFL